MTSSEKTGKVDWCACHEIMPLQPKGTDSTFSENTKSTEWVGPKTLVASSSPFFPRALDPMHGCLMDLHPVTHRGGDTFPIKAEDMIRSVNLIMHPGPAATIRVPSGSDMDDCLKNFSGNVALYAHFCPICPYTSLFVEGNVNAMIYGSPVGMPGKGITLCCVRSEPGSWIYYLMA